MKIIMWIFKDNNIVKKDVFLKEVSSLKENIYRHRAYRKLEKVSKLKIFIEMLIAVVLFDLLILIFHTKVTYDINKAAAYILSPFYHNVKIISSHFLFGEVHLLDVSGRFPSMNFSISVAIVSAIIIIILLFQRFIAKPYTIWMIFTISIILISSLFFILFSKYFPYSMRIFLDLYMKTIICIWLILPWIIISAFAPLPVKYPFKLSFIFFLLTYSLCFVAIR